MAKKSVWQTVPFPLKLHWIRSGRNYAWVPSFLVDMLGLYVNRDGCRTPMQWDAGPNAGFCGVEIAPWLPVHENRNMINVQDQLGDDDSLLNTYRVLLRLRRDTPTLKIGTLELLSVTGMDESILALQTHHKRQDPAYLAQLWREDCWI